MKSPPLFWIIYYSICAAIIWLARTEEYASNLLVGLGVVWLLAGMVKFSAWSVMADQDPTEEGVKSYQGSKKGLITIFWTNVVLAIGLCVFGFWFSFFCKVFSVLGSIVLIGEREKKMKQFFNTQTSL